METLERILAEHPFFDALDPAYEAAGGMCVQCALQAGDVHLQAGRRGQPVLPDSAGKVALEVLRTAAPADHRRDAGEGDILGWSWLLPPYQWKFHARAVETSRAIALDGKCLRTKCEENHDLGYEVLKRFVQIMESGSRRPVCSYWTFMPSRR